MPRENHRLRKDLNLNLKRILGTEAVYNDKKKNEHTRITKTANPVEGGESEYREYTLTLLD